MRRAHGLSVAVTGQSLSGRQANPAAEFAGTGQIGFGFSRFAELQPGSAAIQINISQFRIELKRLSIISQGPGQVAARRSGLPAIRPHLGRFRLKFNGAIQVSYRSLRFTLQQPDPSAIVPGRSVVSIKRHGAVEIFERALQVSPVRRIFPRLPQAFDIRGLSRSA